MTFSEAPNSDLAISDFTVTSGTLSDLTLVGNVATAIFIPTNDTEATATVTLASDSITDLAVNATASSSFLNI